MNLKNILIFFGGCSSEYSVSLSSAAGVLMHLDKTRYQPVAVGITEEGQWFYYTGSPEKLLDNSWRNLEDCVPAVLSPNRGEGCLLVLRDSGVERISIDAALPVLHGRNGEDGTLQGLIELAGIPLAGCGTLSSALCMDKDRAHRLVEAAGVAVPRSLALDARLSDMDDMLSRAQLFARDMGFPIFAKPVKSGSSYGVSRVGSVSELEAAVRLALRYDSRVILEEAVEGFEVGCAVLGSTELITGEVDEIELSGGFFDFTEKYTLKTSAIHVPARISPAKAAEIKETAKQIYRVLDCSGFARVDLFLTPEGRIIFNEVNTIPGFTEHSRYPGMMKAAGIPFREVLTRILESAMR
ncbi:MAG: D-alanine--D-serine ligase VanG [Roseburia sp.]|nr:D-alanine--D-serine ligase VanG [Roseburia sp.]MCM1098146.1 D-alanine--D-serine ligase VanG [Ruminococcus flavefaciens]